MHQSVWLAIAGGSAAAGFLVAGAMIPMLVFLLASGGASLLYLRRR